jgi:hypothetical protein
MTTDTEVLTVLRDSAAVELTYQRAIDGTGDEDHKDNEDNGGEDDGDEGRLDQGNEDDVARVGDAMGWVDAFIFNMRCNGGRQTEASVLKLYKVSTLRGSPWPLRAHRLASGMATWCASRRACARHDRRRQPHDPLPQVCRHAPSAHQTRPREGDR